MNAIPPTMFPGTRGHPAPGQFQAGSRSLKWAALQEAADLVASLAGLEPEHGTAQIRNFPVLIREAAPWRRELADRGMADMTAVMQPGITALLGINARGADARPAALALWREFAEARAAVLALLPPTGTMGPPRSPELSA